jgi:methyl-accepting chemotaxis protein
MEEAGSVQEKIGNQRSTIHETIEQVDMLIADINKSIALTKEIVTNVDKTEKASNTISETISNLSAISEENAASSEETRTSMQALSETMESLSQKANELNDIAKVLDEEMAFFR